MRSSVWLHGSGGSPGAYLARSCGAGLDALRMLCGLTEAKR